MLCAAAGDVSTVVAEARRQGAALPDGRFDTIVLLNVLDRCSEPLTLLRQLRELLVPGSGRLLLAVVLPFRPFVEDGTRKTPPTERLPLDPNGECELDRTNSGCDV
jgi:SAM-dependent methyltransferase